MKEQEVVVTQEDKCREAQENKKSRASGAQDTMKLAPPTWLMHASQ